MSSKMIHCKACGREISAKASACPGCGAKNKKPITKKWWFWVIIVIAVLAVLGNTDPNPDKEKEERTTINTSETSEKTDKVTTTANSEQTKDKEDSSTTPSTEPATEPSTEATTKTNLVNGMRPEFKEAMDSYEAFFDEYCDFMEKYSKNPNDLGLLSDYADFMSKYFDYMEKLENWEDEDLNDAELRYYTEVTLRIEKRLLSVAY